jgi:hypothetical protein
MSGLEAFSPSRCHLLMLMMLKVASFVGSLSMVLGDFCYPKG